MIAGLFFSHEDSSRIDRHYARLVSETSHLITWYFAFNPNNRFSPLLPFSYLPAEFVMPQRYYQMIENGGVQNGFMDVAILPPVLGLDADHTWIMEYDVDFAGNWARLFEQFAGNEADLLTSTVVQRDASPQWYHWQHASCPAHVPPGMTCRAFHPLMRISRRFAITYCEALADAGWRGHYEFTLPTVALATSMIIEDIGGTGSFTPPHRKNLNYENNHLEDWLQPGTFLWRPSRDRYFQEDPSVFAKRDKLYHPVKPGIDDWEKRPR